MFRLLHNKMLDALREVSKSVWIGCLLFTAVILFISEVAMHEAGVNGQHHHLSFQEYIACIFRFSFGEAGGLFAVFFGMLSLVGVWMAFVSIIEFRRVITSFYQLHERMILLINETPKGESIRILAYTPAIGFLALPTGKWTELKTALTKAREQLEIVCLDQDELSDWHKLFIGRRTLREPVATNQGGAKEFLSTKDIELASRESELIMNDDEVKNKSRRKKLEMMPGFYLMFNEQKAIIVTPFFIPFPPGTPNEVQKRYSKVQMFGVETGDRRIIEDVQELFRSYKEDVPLSPPLFSSNTGDISEIADQLKAQIATLQSSELAKEPLLRYRLSVFRES